MAGQTKLMLPSGGSVSISASDSTQNTTVTLPGGDVTLATTSQVMGRNRIINGAMMIDQRNAGASVTPTTGGTYTLDRWRAGLTQSSKYSIQQNAGSVTPPEGFVKYLGITSLSAYSVLTTDAFAILQIVEGFNIADLAWGTANAKNVVLSFWVRSSLTGTFGGSLRNENTDRSYPFTYVISSANTWEQKTLSITGDTTGTWLTNNSGGIYVSLGLGCGSTFSGTAGAWSAGNYISPTGATSVVGTNGATFYITGVQLEKATTATPFEFRPYGQELALCQRYYQQFASTGTGGFYNIGAGNCHNSSQSYVAGWFKTTMRASPSFSYSGSLGTDIKYSVSGDASPTSISGDQMNIDGYSLSVGVSGASGGQAIRLFSLTTSGQVKFSAEL